MVCLNHIYFYYNSLYKIQVTLAYFFVWMSCYFSLSDWQREASISFPYSVTRNSVFNKGNNTIF